MKQYLIITLLVLGIDFIAYSQSDVIISSLELREVKNELGILDSVYLIAKGEKLMQTKDIIYDISSLNENIVEYEGGYLSSRGIIKHTGKKGYYFTKSEHEIVLGIPVCVLNWRKVYSAYIQVVDVHREYTGLTRWGDQTLLDKYPCPCKKVELNLEACNLLATELLKPLQPNLDFILPETQLDKNCIIH